MPKQKIKRILYEICARTSRLSSNLIDLVGTAAVVWTVCLTKVSYFGIINHTLWPNHNFVVHFRSTLLLHVCVYSMLITTL